MILVKLKSDFDVQQTHLGAFTFLLTNKGGWEPSLFYSCIVMTKLYKTKIPLHQIHNMIFNKNSIASFKKKLV
jgi:hypothetical protein